MGGLFWFLLRIAWASNSPVMPAPMMRIWESASTVGAAEAGATSPPALDVGGVGDLEECCIV